MSGPTELSRDVEDAIEFYTPQEVLISSSEWDEIGPLVRQAARCLCVGRSLQTARTTLRYLAHFVAARRRNAIPLTIEALFSHDSVESQIAMWLEEANGAPLRSSARSVATWASTIRTLAPRLHPGGGFPVKRSSNRGYRLSQPMTRADVTFLQQCLTQPANREKGLVHRLAMAFAHGAGARKAEVVDATPRDILLSSGAVKVRIAHPDGSDVEIPLAEPYATWISERVSDLRPDDFIFPRWEWVGRSGDFPRRVLPPRAPMFSMGRMRTTWTAERLAAGLPAPQVKYYGRYETYEFLSWLADYIPPLPDSEIAALLQRGAAL